MDWNPLKIIKKLFKSKEYLKFLEEYSHYNKLSSELGKEQLKWSDRKIILGENTATTKFDTHYIYHPAWAARILAKNKPSFHVDISSTLHFSTMLSAFIPVKFYDFRPAFLNLNGLISEKADLLSLPFIENSILSLSCMHTIEHLGLGRYGDRLDADADSKAAKELIRVLAKNGNLLVVVPVGRPRVMFNAHRIYSYEQIIEMFRGLNLEEFSLIPDNALTEGIILRAKPSLIKNQKYGCGCFWFKKSL